VLADLHALLHCAIRLSDLGPDRRLVGSLADRIDLAQPAQTFVRAVPVVVVNPQRQLIHDVRRPGIYRCPELLKHRPLRALDLTVEVRRAWWDRAELYGPSHQAALHRFG
jgi:hypothetical protein